ncbi:MAG: hypothetical protein E7580_06810 [Ruminococcaceae bacterium]|nr:hypothetical protein [Oscillospiraceae bacterium]
MKKTLALLLCLATLLPLCACTAKLREEPKSPEKVETKPKEKEETKPVEITYPEVHDRLTRAKLEAFPIANDNMTLEEKRQHCIDFFRFMKTFTWTPAEKYKYIIESSGREVVLLPGKIYGSLPYVSIGSGNVYRLLDYYDEETGVVDVKKAGVDPILFGNQCSIGAFWAWSRLCNKANYTWTQNMTYANGFLRVGPYTYDDTIEDFARGVNTTHICQANGKEVMFESYAALQPADGLVRYNSAGHVIMCSEVHVVRDSDGKIDGEKSYILYIDQDSAFFDDKQSNGDAYLRQGNVDAKKTFEKMFSQSMIPFTLPELIGIDPVEKSETTFSFTEGDTISVEQLKTASVTSNYAISDAYVVILDAEGKEVDYKVVRTRRASVKTVSLEKAIFPASMNTYTTDQYTIRVDVQISTGERVTVFSGKLTK